MFLSLFYWLISLFICSLIIPNTHTSLPRWIFLGERFRLVRERDCGGRKRRRGSLFSIFSLITNQFVSLWGPEHSVGRRIGFSSPPFISLLFNTFPSLLLLLRISPVSKCQSNKPRNKIPLLTLTLSFSNRLHVQYFNKNHSLDGHIWESTYTPKCMQTHTQQLTSGMHAVFYISKVGSVYPTVPRLSSHCDY